MTDQLVTPLPFPTSVWRWDGQDPDDDGGPAAGGGAAPCVVRLGDRRRPLVLAA